MSPVVSDHAVLRFMERVLDIDVEALRQIISTSCDRHQGAPCVRTIGARFLLRDGVVVTTINGQSIPHYQVLANLSLGRRRAG